MRNNLPLKSKNFVWIASEQLWSIAKYDSSIDWLEHLTADIMISPLWTDFVNKYIFRCGQWVSFIWKLLDLDQLGKAHKKNCHEFWFHRYFVGLTLIHWGFAPRSTAFRWFHSFTFKCFHKWDDMFIDNYPKVNIVLYIGCRTSPLPWLISTRWCPTCLNLCLSRS